ncbi:MAG: class I SAM-dependent methyltransferase [Opitutus sp.]
MKLRDSGMPERDYWETLLDVPLILDRFGFGSDTGDVAELGCGYGTFTVPLARRIRGTIHAFDIEAGMVEATRQRAMSAGIQNVRTARRDVLADGFGLAEDSCDACLLFNILHGESPVDLLREAGRIVRPGGSVSVIHWRSDIITPRGPAADIRPKPEKILQWTALSGNLVAGQAVFLLPPWHYGVRLKKIPGNAQDMMRCRQ